jgi:hypothetical protein
MTGEIEDMGSKLTVPADFDGAADEQRIAFVQELWDRIAENPDRVPVPVAHRRILEQRLKDWTNPEAGQAWSDVRDILLSKLRKD